jgi:hypothetical protein
MAIETNPSFDSQNTALTKRPLYVVQIEGVLDPLTTFRPQDWEITLAGYGMNGYGLSGYGT